MVFDMLLKIPFISEGIELLATIFGLIDDVDEELLNLSELIRYLNEMGLLRVFF
jgi:hypothetical protein